MGDKLTKRQILQRFVRRDRKRTSSHTLWICFVLLIFFTAGAIPQTAKEPPLVQRQDAVWTAVFGGDIVYDPNTVQATQRKGQPGLLASIRPWLKAADYSTANLGGPLAASRTVKAGEADQSGFDREIVRILKDEGLKVVNLASDDVMAWGAEGLLDTFGALTYHDIKFSGAGKDLEQSSIHPVQMYGRIRVATLGFNHIQVGETAAGYQYPGVLPARAAVFSPLIRRAREQADLVIVHLHFGSGQTGRVHPDDEDLAKAMIDSGADIIIGHHPRRLKEVEVYNQGIIFYSLGVLAGGQGVSHQKETTVVSYSLMPCGTGVVRMIPLFSQGGTSHLPDGVLAAYRRWQIQNALTRRLDQWHIDYLGSVVFTVDHSHVLQGVSAHEL